MQFMFWVGGFTVDYNENNMPIIDFENELLNLSEQAEDVGEPVTFNAIAHKDDILQFYLKDITQAQHPNVLIHSNPNNIYQKSF